MGARRHRTALLALAAALALAAGPARAAPSLECRSIGRLVDRYLEQHIRFHELSDEIAERTAELYLRRLDATRVLFLEDEAAALRAELVQIIAEVDEGRCKRLLELYRSVVERHRAMEEFARGVLSREDFAVDYEMSLVIDPEKRGYAKDREQQRALHEKLIHFQVSNYLASGEELAEAKRRLIHRYELNTRRALELGEKDAYSLFLDTFASALDPHSNYLPAEALEEFQISMGLSLEGIGVALSSRDGYSVVEQVIPGGATDRARALRPSDKIIAVAQEQGDFVDIVDMALSDVVRLIRGKKGTKVRLIVLRQGETTERFQVTIVRDEIDLEEQAAKLRWETLERGDRAQKLAILELPSFYGDADPRKRRAATDVERLLREVRQAGADGLLLDLSRNGGGLLEVAVKISGFFLRSGGIVAVRDNDVRTKVLPDPDSGILYAGPLVVLVSRLSASASEILAGAFQDYGRAVIVGDDHTFGKGTVQTVVTLPAGLGAMKVTTGIFYRPGGTSTQHRGVESDIRIPSYSAAEELGERFQPYPLQGSRIEPFEHENERGSRLLPFGRPRPASTQPWPEVKPPQIAELLRRSAERVARDADFDPIREHLAKAEEDGVVVLSELQKSRDEREARERTGADASADGSDEQELSPQAREALRILSDWVELSRQPEPPLSL